jgi:methyl-accepting chemotaxis protein
MIEAVFGFFALAWVPWALSALLVLGALAVWLHFRLRLRPVIEGLDAALEVVGTASSPTAFRDRFASIDHALAANPIVGDSWRAFAQTLVPVPSQDGALGATRAPEHDFDERILARAGVNLRLYAAVPNYLVGLGLLFTFLGLVAALYFASAGVAATSVQDAQGALRDLLAAATFKFVTSIAGLGASIAYSWREKSQLYRIARRLGALCTALDHRLVPVTREALGVLQLEEMKAQGALLRRLGRGLHVTVPQTVEERLASELIAAVKPMRDGFAAAAQRLAEFDVAAAARLIAAPAAPVAAAAADPGAQAALLEELARLRAALEALPEMLPRPAPAADTELGRTLPRFIELFESSTVGIDAMAERLELALARLKAPLDQLRGAAIERAAGDGDETLSQLGSGLRALVEIRRELERLGRMFRDVTADSRALLAAHHAHGPIAEDRDPELAAALDQLSRTVQRFNERVRAFIGQVDEELARSSQLLTSVVGGLEQRSR